jgi:hypothetical protein
MRKEKKGESFIIHKNMDSFSGRTEWNGVPALFLIKSYFQ